MVTFEVTVLDEKEYQDINFIRLAMLSYVILKRNDGSYKLIKDRFGILTNMGIDREASL
jgi:hypothetical protein